MHQREQKAASRGSDAMGFMDKYKQDPAKVNFDKFGKERAGSRFTPRKSSKCRKNAKLKT